MVPGDTDLTTALWDPPSTIAVLLDQRCGQEIERGIAVEEVGT